MTPLRIGINALYLIPGGVGGTEIYLRGLLAALAQIDPVNQYFLFTNRETGPDLAPLTPNFTLVPQGVRAVSRPARILWEQTILPLQVVRHKLDVMLNPGFTAPLLCACPQVTVFHDLQHKRHPEYFRWFDLPFWNFFLYWSARISSLVLADSDATAADLRTYYRLPEGRMRVVPLGVDAAFAEIARRRRPERFLLSVATLHPHKNLDGLLRAFAIFRQNHPDFRLVVCGMHGFFTGPLHELRQQLGLRDAVDFPGWIPREDLHDLYARAWAFVYPTLFEGFGLPVLEALSAGVPTACSAIEPVAGIAGDAALKFDPRDCEAMAAAIARVTDDQEIRERLAAAGPLRAAAFSWRATAEKTLEALLSATPR
ncbi:MAG TPA: glycosyltransferase family 1 protein [Bryobacteraceae bacterium]|jgi:glycosyltransferase involved in cell wall biosynthesis|nr:glycosyltransferase family 1 protein [Bryobacteraceae bacterium]